MPARVGVASRNGLPFGVYTSSRAGVAEGVMHKALRCVARRAESRGKGAVWCGLKKHHDKAEATVS